MKLRRTRRRGQAMTEVIILIAMVIVGLAWVVPEFPKVLSRFYKVNRDTLAAPF